MAIRNGRIIILECQGNQDGPKFLDGRVGDGTVGLAPITGGGFTGTKWLVTYASEQDSMFFQCAADLSNPKYLDARVGDGTVGLAPNTNPPFFGTKWKVQDLGNYIVTLEFSGKFLDGRTFNGTVGLAPQTGGGFTGTKWKFSYAD
jgi:hypothetical protein